MTGWIVAGAIGFPLFMIALHFIKKTTALQVENASLKKANAVQDSQNSIAARPAADPAALLDRMRNDG